MKRGIVAGALLFALALGPPAEAAYCPAFRPGSHHEADVLAAIHRDPCLYDAYWRHARYTRDPYERHAYAHELLAEGCPYGYRHHHHHDYDDESDDSSSS